MASLISAESQDIVPMVNATSAVNTILACTPLQPGDLILLTSITYNAVRSIPTYAGLQHLQHLPCHPLKILDIMALDFKLMRGWTHGS